MKRSSWFFLAYSIVFFYLLSCLVLAQAVSVSSTTGPIEESQQDDDRSAVKTDNLRHDVVTVQTNFEPAPDWVIEKMDSLVISHVGKSYFSKHFKLRESLTNPDLDKTGALYRVTYTFTYSLKEKATDEPELIKETCTLRVNTQGDLVAYRGIKYTCPRKAYEFILTRSEAESIAIKSGLPSPDLSLHDGNYGYNADNPIPEGSYLWVAASGVCVLAGNPELLFIDVDNGNVIGRKTSTTDCHGGERTIKMDINKMNPTIRYNPLEKMIYWIKSLFK